MALCCLETKFLSRLIAERQLLGLPAFVPLKDESCKHARLFSSSAPLSLLIYDTSKGTAVEKKRGTKPTITVTGWQGRHYVLPESELEKGFNLEKETRDGWLQKWEQTLMESFGALAAAERRPTVGTIPRLVEVPGVYGQPPEPRRRMARVSWLFRFNGDVA